MSFTVEEYFMGRDEKYPDACTDEIRDNAEETVRRWNLLLDAAAEEDVEVSGIASGWRPPAVNDKTSNAAKNSTHLTAEAADGKDSKTERTFARWCLQNTMPVCEQLGKPDLLAEIGLWMEDPRWTPGWVHLQTRAPKSGRRVYIPSSAPAKCEPLPEQQA